MKCTHCGVEWNVPTSFNSRIDKCPFCGHSMQPNGNELKSLEDVLTYIYKQFGENAMKDGTELLCLFSDLAPKLQREKVMLNYFIKCNGNRVFLMHFMRKHLT